MVEAQMADDDIPEGEQDDSSKGEDLLKNDEVEPREQAFMEGFDQDADEDMEEEDDFEEEYYKAFEEE